MMVPSSRRQFWLQSLGTFGVLLFGSMIALSIEYGYSLEPSEGVVGTLARAALSARSEASEMAGVLVVLPESVAPATDAARDSLQYDEEMMSGLVVSAREYPFSASMTIASNAALAALPAAALRTPTAFIAPRPDLPLLTQLLGGDGRVILDRLPVDRGRLIGAAAVKPHPLSHLPLADCEGGGFASLFSHICGDQTAVVLAQPPGLAHYLFSDDPIGVLMRRPRYAGMTVVALPALDPHKVAVVYQGQYDFVGATEFIATTLAAVASGRYLQEMPWALQSSLALVMVMLVALASSTLGLLRSLGIGALLSAMVLAIVYCAARWGTFAVRPEPALFGIGATILASAVHWHFATLTTAYRVLRQLRSHDGDKRTGNMRGSHANAFGSDRDLSRLHESVGQLMSRSARLQRIVNNQPWCTIALDREGLVLVASANAAVTLGVPVQRGSVLAEALSETAQPLADEQRPGGAIAYYNGRPLWLRRDRVHNDPDIAALVTIIDCSPLEQVWRHETDRLRASLHDLRAPQNSILAMTQLHEADRGAFDSLGGIGHIGRLSGFLLNLTENLLRTPFRRTRDIEWEPCDLQVLAQDVVARAQPLAHARKVSLRFSRLDEAAAEGASEAASEADSQAGAAQASHPAPGDATVTGVSLLLARALQNVLDNAIQLSPPGACVQVTLSASPEAVELAVSDQAGGLPGIRGSARLGSFDQWHGRLPGILRAGQRRQGFGIGLRIATELLQLHDGQLVADTVEGRGTAFRLIVPRDASRTGPPAHAIPSEAGAF